MFDLGWSKILILAVVAIVVVGPKELPSLLRTLRAVHMPNCAGMPPSSARSSTKR